MLSTPSLTFYSLVMIFISLALICALVDADLRQGVLVDGGLGPSWALAWRCHLLKGR
jgi:hypothetical protein